MWTIPSEPGYGAALQSLLRRAEASDPEGFKGFLGVLEASAGRFLRQWHNAQMEHDRAHSNEGKERLEALVRWFVNFFETDAYLWFTAVLAKSTSSGRVDGNAFGGPATATAQASLVRETVNRLGNNPLGHVIDRVYDAALRNAIGHNDYEWVTESDGSYSLVDHAADRRFFETQLYAKLAEAQALEQALLAAILGLISEPRGQERAGLSDQGIVATFRAPGIGGGVAVIVFQLWCFAELDPQGTWLDSGGVRLLVECCESCEERRHAYLGFTETSVTPFPSDDVEAFRGLLEAEEWIHVWRVSVAPYIGGPGHRVVLPFGEFIAMGAADRHLLPYISLP